MTNITIPTNIFNNRKLAVLESLVKHLKEKEEMTYKEIARELNRNERTIWTAYNRKKQ